MTKILFESKNAVIALKPSGVLSVPTRLGSSEKRPILSLELKRLLKTEILPVHRLDFEVGGLILFAKSKEFHKVANLWFENSKVKKKYLALTEDTPIELTPQSNPLHKVIQLADTSIGQTYLNPQHWESYLVRGKKRAFEAPYGQKAITEAQVLTPEKSTPYLKVWKALNIQIPDNCWMWDLSPLTPAGLHCMRLLLTSEL